MKPFDFSEALVKLRLGYQLRRQGWNGKGMFVYLVQGSTFVVNRPPLLGIYAEGTEVKYLPHIDMKTADGCFVPWLASQTDLLAEDWEVCPPIQQLAPSGVDSFRQMGDRRVI